MCNNTKHKIAVTLRQMMATRSFDKITVKNLMDASSMQRQSFYYHFQDTRDVLIYICREELFLPLIQSRLEFHDWVIQAMRLIDEDRKFYRKAIALAPTDFVREMTDQVVFPRLCLLLYGSAPQQHLDENRRFVSSLLSNAIVDHFVRFADSHDPLDVADARIKLQFLVGELKTGCGHHCVG